ncbi:MAG: PDZ domain-containing protein [Bacteroidaceae bacterium]|nr:PDZ domain-containing protein [Bacteroidaceae bacterium]
MNKKFVSSLFAMLFGISLFAQEAEIKMPEQLTKLMFTHNIISRFYVDSIPETKMVESGIKAMLKELDPHSTYSDPKEVKALMEAMQGSFEGIGVQFNMVSDTLYVIHTTEGGPSEKAGILAGDRIVAVNDTAIAGVKMERSEIMRRLRGPKGSQVKVEVCRRAVNRPLYFTLTRDKIATSSVDAAYMIDKKNGYISINSFGATTYKDFSTKLDSLKRRGMKNLIIDLQGNGGGYLNAAVDIANELLRESQLVVYTEGRVFPRYDYVAKGGGKFTKGNVAVLIDETSASAAEILAGTIQDWDRGVVVGRRSFGKGLVQRSFNLPDGSMIRLTIARYYTPSGRNIQKPYGDSIPYTRDLVNRYNSGELMSADSIHFPDSLKMTTKRLGRTVYGGGGIMPDYFVPLDTNKYTKYHRDLVRNGSILQATLRYIDNNRQSLQEKYPTVDKFIANYEVDEQLLSLLREQGEADSVKIEGGEEEYTRSLPQITRQLKALVARDIWGSGEYLQIMNADNEIFNKALELIKEPNMDAVLTKRRKK